MKFEKFLQLWLSCIEPWKESTIVIDGNKYLVKDCCTFKKNCEKDIFVRYNKLKEVTKECYFKDDPESLDTHLNRYKRAACLIFGVILCDPIIITENKLLFNGIDKSYLKQRLGFNLGIRSIIQDYPEDKVNEAIIQSKKPLFDFVSLDKATSGDSFLDCIYKDLFYSEHLKNINILTFSNLLFLLTNTVSLLAHIEEIS